MDRYISRHAGLRSRSQITFVLQQIKILYLPLSWWEIQECFSRQISYLTSFSNLAETPDVQWKSSIYLCWYSGRLQSTLGTQSFMKCGRSRPMVYLARSVVKTVVAAPKPNTPIWELLFFTINLDYFYKEIRIDERLINFQYNF